MADERFATCRSRRARRVGDPVAAKEIAGFAIGRQRVYDTEQRGPVATARVLCEDGAAGRPQMLIDRACAIVLDDEARQRTRQL